MYGLLVESVRHFIETTLGRDTLEKIFAKARLTNFLGGFATHERWEGYWWTTERLAIAAHN